MPHHPLQTARIGGVRPDVIAHRAVPWALLRTAKPLGRGVRLDWVGTDTQDGALAALGHASDRGRPVLGSRGGCQQAVLEHARATLRGEPVPLATACVRALP